jgi:uncharacterized membrane protein YoaT (DUF817 family)
MSAACDHLSTTARLRWSWRELLAFGYLNAASCVFPVFIFLMLGASHFLPLPIARYDFMLLVCLLMQGLMLMSGLESIDELKVIGVFHLLGLGLELFKTHSGSWSYPEEAIFKIAGVPLYSGFMYASVASFMTQAWRRFELKMEHWPPAWRVVPLGALIYINFFSHHWFYDLRWLLVLGISIVFFSSRVVFTTFQRTRSMPLVLAFLLIGIFVWFAENIATFLGAWQYPYQTNGWQVVDLNKLSSWALLVIVSFMIVAQLKQVKSLAKLHSNNPASEALK